jgi:hypothetical protein
MGNRTEQTPRRERVASRNGPSVADRRLLFCRHSKGLKQMPCAASLAGESLTARSNELCTHAISRPAETQKWKCLRLELTMLAVDLLTKARNEDKDICSSYNESPCSVLTTALHFSSGTCSFHVHFAPGIFSSLEPMLV